MVLKIYRRNSEFHFLDFSIGLQIVFFFYLRAYIVAYGDIIPPRF